MKKLNTMDMSFFLMETDEVHQHAGGAMIYRLPKNAASTFVRDLHKSMRNFPVDRPPYNYRLAKMLLPSLSKYWEIPTDINIDQHVFRVALPSPGTFVELREMVSRLHSSQLDRSRPLWEVWLIEGLEGNRFAMYNKVHHSLMDGLSGMRLFFGALSEDPLASGMPPFWALQPGDEEARARPKKVSPGTLSQVFGAPRRWMQATKNAGELVKGLWEMSGAAKDRSKGLTAPWSAPHTVFNGKITSRRQVEIAHVPFTRIRALSKALNGTINDVVLGIISGAMDRFLTQTSKRPEESLVASAVVGFNKQGSADGGNAIGGIMVDLCNKIEDPLARFAAVQASVNSGKAYLSTLSLENVGMYMSAIMMPMVLEQITGRQMLNSPIFNVAVSNVPGPRNPLYWNGVELEDIWTASVIFQGQGLNVTVMSYADKFVFNFIGCPDASPQLELLPGLVIDEFNRLESAASAQPVKLPPAKKASPPKPNAAKKMPGKATAPVDSASAKRTASKRAVIRPTKKI